MADPAIFLEIITNIFQRTPPTADSDEPLIRPARFGPFRKMYYLDGDQSVNLV